MNLPALTPTDGGGLCISTDALQPADIIVSTTRAFISGVIHVVTDSPISHALLSEGNGYVIEAVGDGILRRSLGVSLADDTLAVAYRYKGLPEAAASKIVAYADAQAMRHAHYDALGAFGAGMNSNPVVCVVLLGSVCPAVAGGALANQNRFFCSELVLEAFRRVGYPITRTAPGVSSPDRIVEAYSQGVLEYVGHIITS
jgi:hypothetical protein